LHTLLTRNHNRRSQQLRDERRVVRRTDVDAVNQQLRHHPRCLRCQQHTVPGHHSWRTHNHVRHSCRRTWFVFVATVNVTSTAVSLLPVLYAVTDSILTSIVESFRDFATAALKSCATSVAGVSPDPVTRTMACVCESVKNGDKHGSSVEQRATAHFHSR
jgi:hypothetical protein